MTFQNHRLSLATRRRLRPDSNAWFFVAFLFVCTTHSAHAFCLNGTRLGGGGGGRRRQVVGDHQSPRCRALSFPLFAKQKKKAGSKGGGGGGGFGASGAATTNKTPKIHTVKANKDALEKQWDSFASITDLEIKPLGSPDDENYQHFEVADVFCRAQGTGWFRIGKACVSDTTSMEAALTLQKGLIFWTAVHMRREFLALGKAGAASLELGFISPAIVYMGTETDGPLDEDESKYLIQHEKASEDELLAATHDAIGFRPDWNPPGFTYKRRESAARKDKKKASSLQEALEDTTD